MKVFSNKKYVYSPEQANFYIKHGVIPLEIGRGTRGDVYFCFDYHEHEVVYPHWIEVLDSWAKN